VLRWTEAPGPHSRQAAEEGLVRDSGFWKSTTALTILYRINQGDIILLSLRDFQGEKGDVLLKLAAMLVSWRRLTFTRYTADEARSLKAYGNTFYLIHDLVR
jgi:hypothetical protein